MKNREKFGGQKLTGTLVGFIGIMVETKGQLAADAFEGQKVEFVAVCESTMLPQIRKLHSECKAKFRLRMIKCNSG